MQRLMLSLDALVHRRRRWVLAAWLVALIAALPLAARQSDHLTGGGFGVPGSQSDRVEQALSATSTARGRRRSARCSCPRPGAAPPTCARRSRASTRRPPRRTTSRSRRRPARGARQVERARRAPGRRAAAHRRPRRSRRRRDRPARPLGLADRRRRGRSRRTSSGRARCGPGCRTSASRTSRRPSRSACRSCAHPARRLRLARRGGAAARARRRLVTSPAR